LIFNEGMRITAIRDITIPIRLEIRNAWISVPEMTASAVAIHTDAVRDVKPLVCQLYTGGGML